MQTDERAGPVAVADGDELVRPVTPTVDTQGGAMPDRPRFFGRRAWHRRRLQFLEQQAVLDDLTGLRNQRALWHELSDRATSCSAASPLTVVMLDFDRFTEVNGRYGHAVGDAVLERGASVLLERAGSQRRAFRYGGEEFVVLVAGDEEDGCELAEHVRGDIARQNGHLPAVTVSCGVAQLDGPAEPWAALDRADAALREAKRAGRNRVVVAGRTERTTAKYLVDAPENETARRAALAVAVATLEVRDPDTADHADDVLTLCESLGRELGFQGRELEHLMAGAQLHDVGKVAVPSEILNKPGPLDDDEWAVIREHTVIGERILRSVPEMAEVATIVRHSHERWDGGGYPDGLSGESIPLPSRIVLCADAFHAIRSDRPYRAGSSADAALEELRACAGTQFDPAVVEALARVIEQARSRRLTGMSVPRNKRLVFLLTALALSGTAIAAVPELRDAIGSAIGTTAPVPHGPSAAQPAPDSSTGPRERAPKIAQSQAGAPSPAGKAGARRDARPRPERVSAATRRTRRAAVRRSERRTTVSGAKRTASTTPSRQSRPDTKRPVRQTEVLPPVVAVPPKRNSEPGAQPRADAPAEARELAPPAVHCRAESKHKAKGEEQSAYSMCVVAQAQAQREARRDG